MFEFIFTLFMFALTVKFGIEMLLEGKLFWFGLYVGVFIMQATLLVQFILSAF